MADQPRELQDPDRYFAAGTLAHAFSADVHRELAALSQADDQTLALLHESAAIILEQMPDLVRDSGTLAAELGAQALLDDPAAAETTRSRLGDAFSEIEPALQTLRRRQDEIMATLRDRLDRARWG